MIRTGVHEAHLLSVFGNDSDVGAITAAVYEQARFRLTFPDGEIQEASLGEGAICHRGSISIPGRKHTVRHMIALSEELHGMKSLSRTFVLRMEPNEVWTALVYRFGLPGSPGWAMLSTGASFRFHSRMARFVSTLEWPDSMRRQGRSRGFVS